MSRILRPTRISAGVKLFAISLLASGPAFSPSNHEARAATFGALSGTLTIRAGAHSQQTTPAILGTASLNDVDPSLTGLHLANASLTITQVGGSRLQFSGVASSTTNQSASPGSPNALAFLNFSQAFTTATPQWIELSVRVADNDPEVSAVVTLNRTSPTTTVFTQGPTGGGAITQYALLPAGAYSAQAVISSNATSAEAHSGVIDGSILIASLADFNNDLVVNQLDLPTLRSNFASTSGLFANGDLDANGRTDGNDILLWQRQLGTHALAASTTSVVPEPVTGGLAIIGSLAAMYRYRARRSADRRASASPAR